MTIVEAKIPGYMVGTWTIDPVHSYGGFVVTHSMVSKVHGQFEWVNGQIVTAQNVVESKVNVTIDVASFHTNNEVRDDIRSLRFMDAEPFPTMTFASTGIRLGNGFLIEGDLTINRGGQGSGLAGDCSAVRCERRRWHVGRNLRIHLDQAERVRRRLQPRDSRRRLDGRRGHRRDSRSRGESQASVIGKNASQPTPLERSPSIY